VKKNASNLKARQPLWKCSLHRGDANESDIGESVADLYWRERQVFDAEAGVLVDEGFGWFGPLGAVGERRCGGGDGLEVVLDGVAEDGHVGAADGRRPWRGESAIRLDAPGGAGGGGRGLRDGLP
jgi:hypothetical protein